MHEVYGCYDLWLLIWKVPAAPEKSQWLRSSSSGEPFFVVAGMPRQWKVINFLFVLLPKVVLCHYVLWEGTLLVMDTSGITDMVLGAVSMSFILTIDEIMYDTLTSIPSKRIIEAVEVLEIGQDDPKVSIQSVESARGIEREAVDDSGQVLPNSLSYLDVLSLGFPKRLVLVVFVMVCYMMKYYYAKCKPSDGQWVSKDMFLPLTSEYHLWDFVFDSFFHTVPREPTPFWTMPGN